MPSEKGFGIMSIKIETLDSTLRDGVQGEGISFSVEDKLKILKCLDEFGVTYIEAGNPASNPKDIEFFEKTAALGALRSKPVAFGSTRRKDVPADKDEGLAALASVNTGYISIFGKAWDMHVTDVIGTDLETNLAMIRESIEFLRAKGKTVFFDAEHFFDGYKSNPDYAMSVIMTAEKAGAEMICLCDTNGGCFPDETAKIVREASKKTHVKLGIHCHNDNGCAVANTIMAVKNGAAHVQGTFIGIGERTGNTNLSTVIADLQLRLGISAVSADSLKKLTKTARYIAEIANIRLRRDMPYVGSSAFAHKGGMHVDGVMKNTRSFELVPPEAVGNERSLILSEVSGRNAILSRIAEFDSTLGKDSEETHRVIERLKELEHMGYQFEAANASFELLVLRELKRFRPYFEIADFKIVTTQESGGVCNPASAFIKVKVGDRYEITADEGNGPVNAIDKALRKALEVFYPVLNKVHLIDYKVRVINTGASTAAVTRVLIESTDGSSTWTTVGASEDIISASMTALTDSMEYMLLHSSEYNYMSR